MWNTLWTISLLFSLPAASTQSSLLTGNRMPVDSLPSGSGSIESVPDPDHASFDLKVAGERVPFRVMAAFILPGESLPIEAPGRGVECSAQADSGVLETAGLNRWRWRAPLATGLYPVRVSRGADDSITLNVFVMVPYARMKAGRLGPSYIGEYPRTSARRGPAYNRPRGFIEVTQENESTLVVPHFRLKQFVCKGSAAYPKYVVLKPSLLVKLERLIETVHDHGIDASTFQLMSAYRTPNYNRVIGNRTAFSRHHYGDAADIIVDEHPHDGRMDDLNGDGRQNQSDARVLSDWVEDMDRETEAHAGGLATYGSTHGHGPFVHMDARGAPARW